MLDCCPLDFSLQDARTGYASAGFQHVPGYLYAKRTLDVESFGKVRTVKLCDITVWQAAGTARKGRTIRASPTKEEEDDEASRLTSAV